MSGTMALALGTGGMRATAALARASLPLGGYSSYTVRELDQHGAIAVRGEAEQQEFLAAWEADVARADANGAAIGLEVRKCLVGTFAFFVEADLPVDMAPEAFVERAVEVLGQFFPGQPQALLGGHCLSFSSTRVRCVWPSVTVDADQAATMAMRLDAEFLEANPKWQGCVDSSYIQGPPLPGSCEYAPCQACCDDRRKRPSCAECLTRGVRRRDPLAPRGDHPRAHSTLSPPMAWKRVQGTPYEASGLAPSCTKALDQSGSATFFISWAKARALQAAIRSTMPAYARVVVLPKNVVMDASSKRYTVVAAGVGAHWCGLAATEHRDSRARFTVTASGVVQGCFSGDGGGQCRLRSAVHPLLPDVLERLFPAASLNHRIVGASVGGRDRACPAILSALAWAQIQGAFLRRSYTGGALPSGMGKGGRGGARGGGRGGH
jgi:hypothetical protein